MPASRACGRARGSAHGASDVGQFKSYDDPDVVMLSLPLPFMTSCSWLSLWATPTQKHYDKSCLLLLPFVTTEMISDIVTHTNSYANEHIFSRTHLSYASTDGSW